MRRWFVLVAGSGGRAGGLMVAAIVAAYNEERTIDGVLRTLTSSQFVDEVIVVSDGSTDRTAEAATLRGARTIVLDRNQGKGNALRMGVESASNDVLFFVDADLLHFSEEHIDRLVRPVLEGTCDMNIGVRHRGPVLDFLHLRAGLGPVISGIRVLRREVWDSVPPVYKIRFKVELALNFFCAQAGLRQRRTMLHEIGHVKKEKKRGLRRGLAARFEMTREVILLHLDLYMFQSWRWAMNGRVPMNEHELYEVKSLD